MGDGKYKEGKQGDNLTMIDKPHYIKCGPVPAMRDWRSLPTKQLTRAERNMRFCERYLKIVGPDGKPQPLKLQDFQESFLYSILDNPHGTRKAIFSVGRKNGKSYLISCILLCFLVGPEARMNAQIVSGAMSRDQASIIFRQARDMVMLSDELRPLIKVIPSKKTLIGIPLNCEYTALAADGATAVGLDPQLILCDELGQIIGERSDFISALATSQGARQDPLIIYLSTQAPTDGALFSREIDNAITNQDLRTVCHLYAAPEDCDLMDREAWKMANPALGIFRSEQDLYDAVVEAQNMPSKEGQVRNYYFNMRVNTDSPFVSKTVWQENGEQPQSLKGKKVFCGLDLSAVSDLTALVLVSEQGDVECRFWLPKEGLIEKAKRDRVPYDVWEKQGHLLTTPGNAIEYEYVAHELKRIFDEYDIHQINFDRFAMKFLLPWLRKAGFTEKQLEKFNDFGQGFISLGIAVRELETKLLQRKLKHGQNPILTMCAGNAVIEQDAAGNRKFTKKKSTGRIDGMVSLAMAVDALARYEENAVKTYQVFFV